MSMTDLRTRALKMAEAPWSYGSADLRDLIIDLVAALPLAANPVDDRIGPDPDCKSCGGDGVDTDPQGRFDYPCYGPCPHCWVKAPLTFQDAARRGGMW